MPLSVHLFPYGDGKRLLLSHDITARMRRDFVANVSHAIRTPLTVISSAVETLLCLYPPPPEQTHYLDLMSQHCTRMQALTQDLLTLSRLESSPAPDSSEQVDMVTLLQQATADAQMFSRPSS